MLNEHESHLLNEWEDIFKQGLLTFWVLTALQNASLTIQDIGQEVAELTKDTYKPAEQTLYRLLRKQYSLDLVKFTEVPGKAGPKKKLYSLTDVGEKMLSEFTERNIQLFRDNDKIRNILNREAKK